jgi:hypothetical protein
LLLLLFFRSTNNELRAHRDEDDDGQSTPGRRRGFPRAVEEHGERAALPTDTFKRTSVQIVRAGPTLQNETM